MPHYITERTSSRERKLQERGLTQQIDLQGQQGDQQQQAAMMQMLMQLYGLQQQQQMDPLKMQAMQQEAQAKQFEMQHAPELLQGKLAGDKAQQEYYSGKNQGQVTPRDLMQYEMTTGHPYVTPEQRAVEDQKKEQQRQAMIQQDAVQQQQHAPSPTPPPDRAGGLLQAFKTPEQLAAIAQQRAAEAAQSKIRGQQFSDWFFGKKQPQQTTQR